MENFQDSCLDPDPVCPESLDVGPFNIITDPKPWFYQRSPPLSYFVMSTNIHKSHKEEVFVKSIPNKYSK